MNKPGPLWWLEPDFPPDEELEELAEEEETGQKEAGGELDFDIDENDEEMYDD